MNRNFGNVVKLHTQMLKLVNNIFTGSCHCAIFFVLAQIGEPNVKVENVAHEWLRCFNLKKVAQWQLLTSEFRANNFENSTFLCLDYIRNKSEFRSPYSIVIQKQYLIDLPSVDNTIYRLKFGVAEHIVQSKVEAYQYMCYLLS